jgi:hypothetical protein
MAQPACKYVVQPFHRLRHNWERGVELRRSQLNKQLYKAEYYYVKGVGCDGCTKRWWAPARSVVSDKPASGRPERGALSWPHSSTHTLTSVWSDSTSAVNHLLPARVLDLDQVPWAQGHSLIGQPRVAQEFVSMAGMLLACDMHDAVPERHAEGPLMMLNSAPWRFL